MRKRSQTDELPHTWSSGSVSPSGESSSTVAVSVIIPAHNTAPFIGEAVASVFAQSFADYEVIVINDGSADTPELELALRPYWSRIVYRVQPNAGPSSARNHGIRVARGEYVAFLDSDDAWMPAHLATQMDILAHDPTVDFLYCNGIVIGNGRHAGSELMSMYPSRGTVTFERLIRNECTVPMSSVTARRQSLIDAGLFDERFKRAEDFHLWSRLAHRGARIRYHRDVLVKHRCREGSLSSDQRGMTEGAIEVLQDLEAALPLTPYQQSLVRKRIARFRATMALDEARRLFMAGEYDAAATALGRTRRWEPDRLKQARLWMLQVGMAVAPRLLRRTYVFVRRPCQTTSTGRDS
jgi:glycosyltransferase involved in cell wall biosynthesis